MASSHPRLTPVDQERIDAAVSRLYRILMRLESLEAPMTALPQFQTERRLLNEAIALLDPEVKLA